MYNSQSQPVLCLVTMSAGQPVPSKFPNSPDRVKVKVQVGQEEFELWENVPTVIQDWTRGQSQYISKNAKGFWMGLDKRQVQAHEPPVQAYAPQAVSSVAFAQPDTQRIAPTYAPQAQTITGEQYEAQNRDIAIYTKRLAVVYKNCFESVQYVMQDKGLSVENEKDIATSVFIQTLRKFQL